MPTAAATERHVDPVPNRRPDLSVGGPALDGVLATADAGPTALVLCPMVTHLTWSTMMVLALPR